MSNFPPELRAEAAAWLARLHADDKSPADERAFRAWLSEDVRHAQAFESMTDMWDVTGAVWSAPARLRATSNPTRRRALLAGAATAAAAGLGIGVWQAAYAGVYETRTGEQKHIALADGTQLFLDAETRLQSSYDSRTRLVTLEHGRCNFHVMEHDQRPFLVDAAAERIVAGRATFDVRREGDDVCVLLIQGSASASHSGGDDHLDLRAGDRLATTAGHRRLDRPNFMPLLAWQTGQAVFDNDTMATAVREMNRYSDVKLEISNPAIAEMRISGVYHVGDNAAFARSVAALLPLALEIDNNQVKLAVDPTRAKRT